MRSHYIDLTVPMRPGMPVWPGDPEVRFHAGAVARVEFGVHTGTHVDAPRHYIAGARTVDLLDLDDLCGLCEVLDVSGMNDTQLSHALGNSRQQRVLLKDPRGAVLSPDGAAIARRRGIRLIGTESMSIEVSDGDGRVHHALLEVGIVIVETLALSHVPPGYYDLIVLPIPFAGLDGAPCRAVLRCLA